MIQKDQFQIHYDKGRNDVEISKLFKCAPETVRQWRIKNNLESNFSYSSKRIHNYSLIQQLVEEELTDSEISKRLNISKDTVYDIRIKEGFQRRPLNVNKPISFTKAQKEIIFGTLLGDSALELSEKSLNPRFKCCHSITQKEYVKHKHSLLSPYSKYTEYKRKTADKRNGTFYESSEISIGANESFHQFYNMFYKEEGKVIPIDFLEEYYSPLALAIHFMDDGNKSNSYTIATCSFPEQNINEYRDFLFSKYFIETTLQRKHNVVYVRARSRENFTELIRPYIIDSMKYKMVT